MNVVTPFPLRRVVESGVRSGVGLPSGETRWTPIVTFLPFGRFDIEATYHRDGGTDDGPCFVADLVWGTGPTERMLLCAADTREEMQRELPEALACLFGAYMDSGKELPGLDWSVIVDPTKSTLTTSDTEGG